MIHDPQHTIITLTVRAPLGLHLVFADGKSFDVDMAPVVAAYPALRQLGDERLFAKARLDARGGYVVWTDDDLEMAADNLRNLAVEQSGGIGHERIVEWMAQHELTQERAATAIGISRRMLNYYLSGARPVPKTIWLACLGWESQQRERKARHHSGKRSPVPSRAAA